MFDTKHGFTAVTGLNATSSTLEEIASEFISYQANQTADYDSQLGFQDQIRALLDERLKDERGVNIDQELVSLIQLESAFAASDRGLSSVPTDRAERLAIGGQGYARPKRTTGSTASKE